MNDKTFLRYALEQSFRRPQNNAADFVALHYEEHNPDGYTFTDKMHTQIVPCYLPCRALHKYIDSVAGDIKRNLRLFEEYNRYKHDLVENIIIPEKLPEVIRARQILDLVTVNRQSAQKKKIAATLIPASFAAKMKEIHRQYREILFKSDEELQKNQTAVDLSVISDFAEAYAATMRKFGICHPLYRRHKKPMQYYLNEAAQILKSHHPLAEDFCRTHEFNSPKYFGKKAANDCTEALCRLVEYIKHLAHQPQLLTAVQALLADHKKYAEAIEKFKQSHNIEGAERIAAIRHDIQKLFEKYALLCYLDGARFAFENKFLNECPEPRHPPLPTVAPEEELKKVSKIVAESLQIDASAGKIGQLYQSALNEYEHEINKLQQLLKQSSH